MDHSTLSKILSGKRSLGAKAIGTLVTKIDIDPKNLERLCASPNSENPDVPDYHQLHIDTFSFMSDWIYYAILEFIHLDSKEHDSQFMAKALGKKKIEIENALSVLERLGLIKRHEDGKIEDLTNQRSTNITSDMKHAALRKMQKDLLFKSIEAIDQHDISKRDNTSVTMAIDSKKLPEAKEMLKKFRREFAEFLTESESLDEVYNLSLALTPLTNFEK